ncbi:MAG TPA: hypothetical protein VEU96_30550 [Bryobacteraceae bacterium]|nr:hypothetical protein [Bryobacteraceae bacterium]
MFRLSVSELLLTVAFAACVSFQLFVPPSIGLANNGDFAKMIGRFSLGPDDWEPPQENDFLTRRWVYNQHSQWVSDNRSSELIPIFAALYIGWQFSSQEFDIRILGAIHALLWICCFAAFLPLLRPLPGWRRYAAAIAALFVFTDVSYVAYCNSFYTDTAAFLSLSWAIVLWLHLMRSQRPRAGLFAFFLAASILCASTKPQHSLLGLILCVPALIVASRFEGRRKKVGAAAFAFLIPLATLATFLETPRLEKETAEYAVIFTKILPKSPAPPEDARELGLGPEYLRYSGYWANQPSEDPMNNPEWRTEFGRRTSHGKMAAFYLRHPLRAMGIVYRDLRYQAPERRPKRLGNYPRDAGYPPKTQTSSFGWWSAIRSPLFRIAPWHIVVWYAVFLTMGIRLAWRDRGIALLSILLVAMGLLELGLTTLADAGETERHLFLFHAITDFTMLLALVWALLPNKRSNV